MILPQGKAFDSLKNRLDCANLLFIPSEKGDEIKEKKLPDTEKYINMFVEQNRELVPASYKEFLGMITG